MGDIRVAERVQVTREISLIPGDLALSGFEDELSNQWPASMGDANLVRPFKVLTAFWQVMQAAATAHDADLIMIDVGPNLGAINRSALIASDAVLIPLGADLFSLQGLRNLGPTLLKSAEGAIGAHSYAVQDAYKDYRALAKNILARMELG